MSLLLMTHLDRLELDRRVSQRRRRWIPPSVNQELYVCMVYGCRYHATLLLKRMHPQEQGQYTFHARSNMTNASITFQVQMYRT